MSIAKHERFPEGDQGRLYLLESTLAHQTEMITEIKTRLITLQDRHDENYKYLDDKLHQYFLCLFGIISGLYAVIGHAFHWF